MPTAAHEPDTNVSACSPPESSRDRIVAHSLSLFSARGYHGVSMNDISQAVGITKAALYYHFEDKESLFIAAMRSKATALTKTLEPIITSNQDLDTLLRQVALLLLDDGLGEYRQLQGDLFTAIDESRRKECLHDIRRLMQLLVARIEREETSRSIATGMNLEVAVSLFFSMIGGQIRRFALGTSDRSNPQSHTELADLIVRIWLHGVLPYSHGESR